MKFIKAILLLCCLTVSSLTLADEMGPDAREFESTLQSFSHHCQEMQCQLPYKSNAIFTRQEVAALTDPLYSTLNKVAFEQAQIWSDTILEGDYQAAGQTRLDQIYALYENDILIGYRITYSEQAWDTSSCDYYNGTGQSREDALRSCPEGRILESSFVSPIFTTFIRDANQFAEFKHSK